MKTLSILPTLTLLLAVACPSLAADPAPAPASPASPAHYDVVIRYDIDAFRNERIVQFREMLGVFQKLGLAKGEGPEDEEENREVRRMTGRIAAGSARKLLGERHVRALRLVPAGQALPKAEEPVRVQLELAGVLQLDPGSFLYPLAAVRHLETTGGPALARQRLLADQTRTVLQRLGFREATAYDHRGHTRLLGVIPSNKLDTLLEDLRSLPEGGDIPAPFASRWPLLAVEVRPDLPLPRIAAAPAGIPQGQEKLTPELRGLVANTEKPERMEVILWVPPSEGDLGWRGDLVRAAPGLVVEGRIGPVVSVLAPASQALTLASLPGVSTIRLPRSGHPRLMDPLEAKSTALPLPAGPGRTQFLDVGRRGRGVPVVVIDGDFRGWQGLVGKGLPARTRLLDLTAERQASLLPDPMPGDPATLGRGTRLAQAAAEAAPEADLLLVRIDPAAAYQLLTIARALSGDAHGSLNLEQRVADLELQRDLLASRGADLLRERRTAFDARGEADEIQKILSDYREKQKKFDEEEREHQARVTRYVTLEETLRGLRKVKTVICGLAWHEGFPVDGGGALARYFDDRPVRPSPWLQVTRSVRGQVWSGSFIDAGGNGLLQFRSPDQPLPAGLWNPSLAFLGWQSAADTTGTDLPAGARIRTAIQWREAHDAEFLRRGEDLYRDPLTPLNITLLRQLDPMGQKQPADDFDVVAVTSGLPQRIENLPHSAVYEQTLEFVVKQPGRYALQVAGRSPDGTRPASVPTIPVQKESWDLRSRLFVETFDGAGRAVLRDFATTEGIIGTPGDAFRTRTERHP